jgi:hypothetical protein
MPINRFVFIINGSLVDILSKNYSRAMKKAVIKYLGMQNLKGLKPGDTLNISLTYLAKFSPYDKKWRERVHI